MFNVEEFEQWINQKQHGRKIEEDLQLLSPDVATDQDMFGYVSLDDIADFHNFEEQREIHFISSKKLTVRRVNEETVFASLEEAMPGGRDQWKFVNYFICPKKMVLVLQFLPISEEMIQKADKCLDAFEHEWGVPDPLSGEDWTEVEEKEDVADELMGKYMLQLELTGSYKVAFTSKDGSEYVRQGRAKTLDTTTAKTSTKTRIQYIEFANDLKTREHILTEGEKTMRSIYYN